MNHVLLMIMSASCVLCTCIRFEYVSCLYNKLLFYLLCGFCALCMIDDKGRTGANMSKESTACLAPLVLYMICSYIVYVCL